MEVQTRKRDGGDDALDSAAAVMKRSRNGEEITVDCTAAGDLDDDIVAWLSLDGETVDELMKFLDADGGASASSSSCSGSPVKFIENPYCSPLIFQSSCSYITINGNEESCGSSFSDWESSVMASVDVGGAMRNGEKASESDEFCEWFQGGRGGAWGLEEARGMTVGDESGGLHSRGEGRPFLTIWKKRELHGAMGSNLSHSLFM